MPSIARQEGAQIPVAVMFSGGRDSTLAAAYYAENHGAVHLLTFENVGRYPSNITSARVDELRARWPGQIAQWSQISVTRVFREIALRNLAIDVAHYGCNLVCLGSALAMVARSIDYCVSRAIGTLAVGYTAYQQVFPEQSPVAIGFMEDLARMYGIALRCPMLQLTSESQACELLESLGLSPKALEPTGLWDWTYPEGVDEEVVQQYLSEKRDIATRHIALLRDFRNASDCLTNHESI